MGPLMTKAWEHFDKALSFDAKVSNPATAENLKRMATKAVDKNLDLAVQAEAVALAAGESH